jgi:hypothetical protein
LQSCPGCPEGCFCILINLTRLFSKFILFQPPVQEDIKTIQKKKIRVFLD